ncbi:MAG TPA: shikimate dehydrogenase [Terriglobales bacterium]|nr:shikimate dehydrogenase [Terriglobales bacterium]
MAINFSPGPRLLPLRLPRVCVAISGRDGAAMVEKAEAICRDNPFVEFRLDHIRQPGLALQRISRFLEVHPQVIAVATCRRASNGGRFKGSVASQVEILAKAARAGCQIIDVELQTAESLKSAAYAKLRSLAAVALSFHDFRGTRKLDETYDRMRKVSADIYKVVSTATTLADNVTMMHFLERFAGQENVVGVCMGEQGIISRVLALRAGSLFTFASAAEGEETAPGQISIRNLNALYRIDYIDRATRIFGVAGNPVGQSLSPLIMNAAFRRETVNGVFLPLHAKTVLDLLTCIREVPVQGISITMPYKQAILEHLDNTDALTARIGACNTVVRTQDGKLFGFNTDVAGVLRPLEHRLHITGARILVLGAGGAARAAVFGLKDRGAEVYVTNRTVEKAQKLARQAKAHYIRRADLKKTQFDVIINATSVGMGNSKESPLVAEELNAKLVFDMVYQHETRLLRMAREKGLQVITGEEMFVHQAARQFEIWTAKPAPVSEMWAIIHNAVAARNAAHSEAAGADKRSSSGSRSMNQGDAPAGGLSENVARPPAAGNTSRSSKSSQAASRNGKPRHAENHAENKEKPPRRKPARSSR